MIQGKLPPQGAAYAYRWLVPKAGAPTVDHYVFLDANQKELASIDQDTTYDPRVRPWYRAAEEAHAIIISDPDVFASEAVIGVTVAAAVLCADGKLLGGCGGRHHAGRSWRVPRRAQDQSRHLELYRSITRVW